MGPAKIYYKIRKEKSYLLKTYLVDFALMSGLILALLTFDYSVSLELSALGKALCVIAGIINGLVISSLLHNTSHANIKSALLNRLVGEYCGFWVLYGYSNFTMVHMLHHQFSDGELDPVNPEGMSFFVFLTAPMRYMIMRAKKFLFIMHGHHDNYETIMKAQVVIFHANLLMRAACWYLILGPALMTYFFVPAFLSIVFVFAHINYVCHRNAESGEVEIVNIDHNIYYKLVKFFTMGGYYHLNHHLNMKVFNPKSLKVSAESPKKTTITAA